jgi:integrase
MADMRRPLYLHKKITRHGKVAWYFWPGYGPRIRIRGEYGSPEFLDAYKTAMAGGVEPQKRSKEAPETLAWLIARYRDSGVWAALSPATKRQRENIFKHVIDRSGDFPYSDIDRAAIVAGRDNRGPAAAKNFVAALRGLFKWAVDASLLQDDPTAGVQVARPKTDGFHVWSEDEISIFESRWPVGTRERLAFAIFLYTGLRRGDAARLGRQHIRNGLIDLRTEKTGTQILIPVLPVLQEIIDSSPTGDLALIATKEGRPMTKESLGNWFREAAKAAGVPGNCHGLRKAGATRLAEAGATVHELNAIYGWSGSKMASLYTESADRARLARRAIGKLENKS